ncbi:hypothetical protein V6N13_084472 [Hibiscus sabdariffa]
MQEAIPYKSYSKSVSVSGSRLPLRNLLSVGGGLVADGGAGNDMNKLVDVVAACGAGARGGVRFPAVFVGGKLFGELYSVMPTHISGELVPILKDAGALLL